MTARGSPTRCLVVHMAALAAAEEVPVEDPVEPTEEDVNEPEEGKKKKKNKKKKTTAAAA